MKFYETSAEEYISSTEKYNLHPEWNEEPFPTSLKTFENMIVYGPVGSGKYSQILRILKRVSPSELKYEKRMTVQSEKQTYCFKMSDIHYEVDMAFLGCNSKTLWHDVFFQIVDIVSVKPDKTGIIVCKNFHMIHSELLEIFYSYMQRMPATSIKFVIVTEHISFIPNNIIQSCAIIPIKKPSKNQIMEMVKKNKSSKENATFIKRISGQQKASSIEVLSSVDTNMILNLKEIQSFSLIKDEENLPTDIFNIICDQIIEEIENIDHIPFTQFRDSLYDIMIYNLDVVECLWYIISHFIQTERFTREDSSDVLEKTYSFLQYFNNNYRPIYHLENIMFYIINKLKKYDVNRKSAKCPKSGFSNVVR
jgi:uncharacterized membrane protein (UPF0127 family)